MFDPRKPPYSIEDLREMLWYLPETGQFVWKVKRGSTPANSPAGTWNRKVKYITLIKKQFKAAELAYYLTTGIWAEVYHKDGNTKNNRWDNLDLVNPPPKIECPVKNYLHCLKTNNGWEIVSDLPAPFVDVLRTKLDQL